MQLKEYLISRHFTYQEFADLLGVKRVTVAKYALGTRKPSSKIAKKIVEITKNKVTLEDLL